MQNPAIVIAAYNRADSLQRLLNSISRADYSGFTNVPLVISLDGAKQNSTVEQQEAINAVRNTAEAFIWQYGEKRVIVHEENIGLRKHIISCGDLTEEYDRVIMLEDDLFVSPYFYHYAIAASDFYADDDKIAGISLYLYRFHEYNNVTHFLPQQNGYDAFFMQIPSSFGELWTKQQWQAFKRYYDTCDEEIPDDVKMPYHVKKWSSKSSWKKFFYWYMVSLDKYFVYPYIPYSTCMAEEGEHISFTMSVCQNALMLHKKDYHFIPFQKNSVVYDAFMELLPEFFWQFGFHSNEMFIVDCYGTKRIEMFGEDYWLTSKKCVHPIEQYAMDLIPIENNILFEIVGTDISFVKKAAIDKAQTMDDFLKKCIFLYDYWNAIQTYNLAYKEGYERALRTHTYRIGRIMSYPYRFIRKILHV